MSIPLEGSFSAYSLTPEVMLVVGQPSYLSSSLWSKVRLSAHHKGKPYIVLYTTKFAHLGLMVEMYPTIKIIKVLGSAKKHITFRGPLGKVLIEE